MTLSNTPVRRHGIAREISGANRGRALVWSSLLLESARLYHDWTDRVVCLVPALWLCSLAWVAKTLSKLCCFCFRVEVLRRIALSVKHRLSRNSAVTNKSFVISPLLNVFDTVVVTRVTCTSSRSRNYVLNHDSRSRNYVMNHDEGIIFWLCSALRDMWNIWSVQVPKVSAPL